MNDSSRGLLAVIVALAAVLSAPLRASAAPLTLTSSVSSAGYSLTTFASGFPTSPAGGAFPEGPIGIAFPGPGGQVLVTTAPGNIYLFPTSANGQVASSANLVSTLGFGDALGLAKIGTQLFMGQETSARRIVRVNPDGSLGTTLITLSPNVPEGITVNPANNHLLVSSYPTGIYDVDPSTGVSKLIVSGTFDGLASDGVIVYAANLGNSHVQGFRMSDGVMVFDTAVSGGADGIALGTGTLAGNLFVNTNAGTFIEINLGTSIQTTIASGGTRGDFVTVAPDGTLFITQSETIERLTAPAGGGFANPNGSAAPTPEPATLAVFGLLAAGALGYRRLRAA